MRNICSINPKNNYLIPDTFLYIDLESVKSGVLVKEQIIYKENAPSRAQRCLEYDDILYSCVRPYQHNNFIFKKHEHAVSSTGFAILRNQTSSEFLYCLVDSKLFESKVLNCCTGTSYPAINTTDLGNIEIFYPEEKEQEKIGSFINLLNKRIETQNKIIEKYESLIKHLNDDLFSHDSNSKIGTFIQESSKRNKDGSITNVLSVSNKNGFVKQSEQFEDKELASEDKTNYKIVQKGDFAFNPARINVGSIALLKNQEIGIVSPMYICFKAKNIPNEVLESYFSSSSFKKEMNKRLEGSVRMCLTIDGMKNIPFHKPSEKEADTLNHLTKLKELVSLNKRILALYNSQKSYLLSNLFI